MLSVQKYFDGSLTTAASGRRRFTAWLLGRYAPIAPDPLACDAFPTSFVPSAGPNLATQALLEGVVPARWDRVSVIQPCIRYWDLPHVGDGRHLSCFEMATFVSLRPGDRARILRDLFELLAEGLELDAERFWVTVYARGPVAGQEFPADEEARACWLELGIPEERIVPVLGSEGFVANRQEAVGGYRTEIYYEARKTCRGGCAECLPGSSDCGRFVEVATSVTYSFAVDFEARPSIRPVVAPPVHAGGFGLERAVQVGLGLDDIGEVDSVARLSETLWRKGGKDRPLAGARRAATVAADHLKALTFLAAENAHSLPGRANKGRRSIVNRYVRSLRDALHRLELTTPSALAIALPVILDLYGEPHPHLCARPEELAARLRWLLR